MGGLALVTRAEKLHVVIILALITKKSLWIQVQYPVASIGKHSNATYLVAGKFLEPILPKLIMKIMTGQEQNLGKVKKKGIG